jgi:beta-glucanase (GH16 family)
MFNARDFIASLAAALLFAYQATAADLVFNDEFSSGRLESSKWTISDGYNAFNYEGELECYVQGGISFSRDRSGSGYLNLTARKQDQGFTSCNPSTHPWDLKYSSGRITTFSLPGQPRFSFQYGYAEARMKFPPGKGLWPAFWMMPSDTSFRPEIDIVEWIGADPRTAHLFVHASAADVYCPIGISRFNQDQRRYNRRYNDQADWTQSFHTFGVNVTSPGLLDFYIDGNLYCSAGTPAAPIAIPPMYMLINLAVGGAWGGAPDATTRFPATLQVDYVRVYNALPGWLRGRP